MNLTRHLMTFSSWDSMLLARFSRCSKPFKDQNQAHVWWCFVFSHRSQISRLSFLSFFWYILYTRRHMNNINVDEWEGKFFCPLSFMCNWSFGWYLCVKRELPFSLGRSIALIVFFLIFILVHLVVLCCVVIVFVLYNLSHETHEKTSDEGQNERHKAKLVLLISLLSLTSYSVTLGPAVTVETDMSS